MSYAFILNLWGWLFQSKIDQIWSHSKNYHTHRMRVTMSGSRHKAELRLNIFGIIRHEVVRYKRRNENVWGALARQLGWSIVPMCPGYRAHRLGRRQEAAGKCVNGWRCSQGFSFSPPPCLSLKSINKTVFKIFNKVKCARNKNIGIKDGQKD